MCIANFLSSQCDPAAAKHPFRSAVSVCFEPTNAATANMLGRKRRLDVWTHFKYNSVERKSECIILRDGKTCGARIAGKNTTNLKRHIKINHPDIKVCLQF